MLANMGMNVDLYLWEEPGANYTELLPETITIKYFREPKINMYSKIHRLRQVWLPFQFLWRKGYCGVFGYGQIGACIGNIIAQTSQCPFIYFNDEFPSFWGKTAWTRCEQQAVKKAAMIVVPDPYRFIPLSQELDVSEKPHVFLPNMPIIKSPFEETNWHKKLGLPENSIPFLYAGTIAEWAQIPEILASLPYWDQRAVLILHSRSRSRTENYRRELSHLEVPGKVIWTHESISDSQLNSLVSYCAGNFALYRDMGTNFAHMGFSSGKLMRSLACGSPVIASRGASLSFIEDNQLGVLVNHPAEIPQAVGEIIENRESYSQRCLEFCRTHVSFEKAWQDFWAQFQEVLDVDLSSKAR
jgi:glycosyltransferase involved in cell wall biosynthesis